MPLVADACGIAPLALTGRVVDAAHLIDAPGESRLATRLATLERETQHQLVVVTLPSLSGREIEEVSKCLGNSWGVGRKAENDGVMLVVAPNDRKTRIEVGLGLEAALTDEEAKSILDTAMLPAFAKADFANGIDAGVDAIEREVS